MYCIYCGYKNSDDASFCVRCGRPLQECRPQADGSSAQEDAREQADGSEQESACEQAGGSEQEDARMQADGSEQEGSRLQADGSEQKDVWLQSDGGEQGDVTAAPQYLEPPKGRGKPRTGLLVGLVVAAGIVVIAAVVTVILILGAKDRRAYDAVLERGDMSVLEADYDDAIDAFNEAIALDASNVAAYTRLCDVYITLGDYNRAMEVIDHGMTVVDDTEPLEEKQQEIDHYLTEGNPGTPVITPDTQDGQSGADTADTAQMQGNTDAADASDETDSSGKTGETGASEDGTDSEKNTPDMHAPWATADENLLLINDHFIVTDYDSINIYNTAQELEYCYKSEELWYISTAVTDGTVLYFAANYRDSETMTETGAVYRMDIEQHQVEEIFRNEGRSVSVKGMSGDYLYYDSATAEEFYNPSPYRLNVVSGTEEPLGIENHYIVYVGADFLLMSGKPRQMQAVELAVYSLDGTSETLLTDSGQGWAVSGRTIYYAQAEDAGAGFPCVIRSYNIDTKETKTLTESLNLMSFELLEDESGILTMVSESSDVYEPDTLVKLEFADGESETLWQGDMQAHFKELNGKVYIWSQNELLRWEEGKGTEVCLTFEGEIRDVIWQDGHYFVSCRDASGNPMVTLMQD